MKRILLLLTSGLLMGSAVMAAVPGQMNVQGRLLSAGSPMNGGHPATFRIYDSASGGTALWIEDDSLSVQNGIFSAVLGQAVPIPTLVFSSQPRWLEVTVEGSTLSPRLQLTTSAYAFWSQRADTAAVALSGAANGEQWETDGTNVWRSTGHVGIGNPDPIFSLDVAGGDTRFQRDLGGADFIDSVPPTDVRLFSQANIPVNIGTNGDAFKLSIQGNGRINVKNALGIGPATPWTDNGIYLDAGSQQSYIGWDNRSNTGFLMYQAQASDGFYFASSGGGSAETWNYVSSGLGNLLTIGSTSTFYRSLNVSSNLNVGGNLFVGGTKCRTVKDTQYGDLYYNAVESDHANFTSSGRASLKNGKCHVDLDPRWLAGVTIDDTHPLDVVSIVFYGPHGNWYATPGARGFDIIDPNGSSSEFCWTAQARQKGYEDLDLNRPAPIAAK